MDKINIAICDDDKVFRDTLTCEISSYASVNDLDFNILCFSNGLELMISEVHYNLIFLDYRMGIMNGLETAKKLRAKGVKCPIIFVTSFNEIVYDVFEVNAFRFITKPVENEVLTNALNDFMEQHRNIRTISFNSNGNTVSIDSDDIVYVEGKGRGCVVHTDRESYPVLQKIELFSEVLPESDFFRSHRLFTVNMKYVRACEKGEITFHNAETAKLSMSKRDEFKKALSNFRERKL